MFYIHFPQIIKYSKLVQYDVFTKNPLQGKNFSKVFSPFPITNIRGTRRVCLGYLS